MSKLIIVTTVEKPRKYFASILIVPSELTGNCRVTSHDKESRRLETNLFEMGLLFLGQCSRHKAHIQHNNWYSYWHVQLFLIFDQSRRLSALFFQSPPFIKVKTKNEAALICAYNPSITSLCLTLFQRRYVTRDQKTAFLPSLCLTLFLRCTRHTSNTPSKPSICLT